MRDSRTIQQAWRKAQDGDRWAALATVVKTEGSTYRRPGARMLIGANSRRTGSVSGGCLEADVAEHAQEACESGISQFVLYDPKLASGDLIWELGCKGVVGILIEPVTHSVTASSLEFLHDCLMQRKTGVVATVFRAGENCPVQIGSRLLLSGDDAVSTGIDFAPLREAMEADARVVLASLQTENRIYRFDEGTVEVLIEAVVPPVSLLICGAGYDAVPLAESAARLGWQVAVADHRANMLHPDRFPSETVLLHTSPEKLLPSFTPDARTVAVLMTHSEQQDRDYLRVLLPLPVCYLGLLGPRSRGMRLIAAAEESNGRQSAASLARIHSPAGLDIGSETPEEIALAILAEIQAALTQSSGAALRTKQGAIHAPTPTKRMAAPAMQGASHAWHASAG